MLDKEQISIMIKDIERYLSDLSEMDIQTKKDLEEKEKYYAMSMVIFAVMNRTIDIGNEILAGTPKAQTPGTYKDTFEILTQNKIISANTSNKMIKLMKYPNVIAHEYYTISVEEMYRLKNELHEVDIFVDEIKKYLKNK